MTAALTVPRYIYDQMVAHARAWAPLEACGLVGGRGNRAEVFCPTANAERSPVTYAVPPRDLFRILRALEAAGLELVGIFHSHPATAAYPSDTDVRLAFYPQAHYLILSLADPRQPMLRAFRIREGRIGEVSLVIV